MRAVTCAAQLFGRVSRHSTHSIATYRATQTPSQPFATWATSRSFTGFVSRRQCISVKAAHSPHTVAKTYPKSNKHGTRTMATGASFPAPIQASIEEKLSQELTPVHLEVINESFMHNVPKGSETHFKVCVCIICACVCVYVCMDM